jgi:hypothetical protein
LSGEEDEYLNIRSSEDECDGSGDLNMDSYLENEDDLEGV